MNEIYRSIIAIHVAMDLIDYGYHGKEISDLVKVSNKLFDELDENLKRELQERFDHWYDEEELQE